MQIQAALLLHRHLSSNSQHKRNPNPFPKAATLKKDCPIARLPVPALNGILTQQNRAEHPEK